MTLRTGWTEPRRVEIDGEIHIHRMLGLVEDGDWTGFDSKRPLECDKCVAKLDAFRQTLCDKYGWDEWPL